MPSIGARLRFELERERQEWKKWEARFDELASQTSPARRKIQPLETDVINVGQKEVAATRNIAGLPRYSQTFGADPCIVLTIWFRQHTVLLKFHLDMLVNFDDAIDSAVRSAKRILPSLTNEEAEARLLASENADRNKGIQLVSILEGRHGIAVAEVDFSSEGTTNVVTDSATGRVEEITGAPQNIEPVKAPIGVMNPNITLVRAGFFG